MSFNFLASPYLFSHYTSDRFPRHWVSAHRTGYGSCHLVVASSTDEVPVVALVDVAGGKPSANWTFEDILQAILASRHFNLVNK